MRHRGSRSRLLNSIILERLRQVWLLPDGPTADGLIADGSSLAGTGKML